MFWCLDHQISFFLTQVNYFKFLNILIYICFYIFIFLIWIEYEYEFGKHLGFSTVRNIQTITEDKIFFENSKELFYPKLKLQNLKQRKIKKKNILHG